MRALPVERYQNAKTDDEVRARQLVDIRELQNALESMHKGVTDRTTLSRRKQVELHNRLTNIQPVNFSVGDFVLVRRATASAHKLGFKWIGPRRIREVKSELVFEVEDLLHGKTETVHARRLLLYRADLDGENVHEDLLRAAHHTETLYQDANASRSIRKHEENIEVQVEWSGLSGHVDLTWKPLLTFKEDIPEMLEAFLHSPGQRKLKQAALEQCSL